jgi:hypothetical protein
MFEDDAYMVGGKIRFCFFLIYAILPAAHGPGSTEMSTRNLPDDKA